MTNFHIRLWQDSPDQEEYTDVTERVLDVLKEARDRIRLAPGPPPFRLNAIINDIEGKTCMCDGGGSAAHVPGPGCTSGQWVEAERKGMTPEEFKAMHLGRFPDARCANTKDCQNDGVVNRVSPIVVDGKEYCSAACAPRVLTDVELRSVSFDMRPGTGTIDKVSPAPTVEEATQAAERALVDAERGIQSHRQCINCAHCDEQHDSVLDSEVERQEREHGAWCCSPRCIEEYREEHTSPDDFEIGPDPITQTSRAAGPEEHALTKQQVQELANADQIMEHYKEGCTSSWGHQLIGDDEVCRNGDCGMTLVQVRQFREHKEGLEPREQLMLLYRIKSDRPVTYDDERPDGSQPST